MRLVAQIYKRPAKSVQFVFPIHRSEHLFFYFGRMPPNRWHKPHKWQGGTGLSATIGAAACALGR